MQITSDRSCEVAKAKGAARADIPVVGAPGLALRVTSEGHKSWTLRYRRQDGKQRRLALGTYPDVRLKDARERARKARNEASDGGDPAGAKQDRRKGETFEGMAVQWIAFKERQGRSESYTTRSTLRLALFPAWFRDMKAADVKRVNVTAALDAIAKRGAKTETNRHQALISAVFKWGVSEGLLEHDPSQGVRRRFDEAPRERVLSNEEVRAFWYGLDSAPASESARIAMRLCFVLGQRPKEIAHLRQDRLALDLLLPTATIEKATSKNRVEHIVPLPRMAVELLRRAVELAPGSEWVFPSPTAPGPIDPHAFAKIVHRARDPKTGTLFGMKDVQLYDAKKTIATFLGDAGHPDQFIGLLFNHLTAKSGTVTGRHYNHAKYLQTKRDLIEQWARHLAEALGVAADLPANVVKLEQARAIDEAV